MAPIIGGRFLPGWATKFELRIMMHMPLPKISIALCTYNGEAHLREQWDSLLKQTRQPDEIVVCDDRSTDGTWALVQELAAQAPFTVVPVRNDAQLGFNKNFEQALSRCTGDLVFICDQDDYWFPEKLQTMTDFMELNPDVQIAFCNAYMADDALQNLDRLFWTQVRLDDLQQQRWKEGLAMEVLLDGNRMMGCATVIRRTFMNRLLPIPTDIPSYIYDGWISLVGASMNVIQFVDKPLQLYRTHAQQQVGVRGKPPGPRIRLSDRFSRDRSLKLEPLAKMRDKLLRIRHYLRERVDPTLDGMQQLDRKLAHYTMRSTLPDNRLRRLWPVLNDLQKGNYHRYADPSADWYSPYLAAVGDMLE